MKILHVVSRVSNHDGGIATVVPKLCEELAKRGHAVRLIASYTDDLSDAAIQCVASGVDVRLVKTWGEGGRYGYYSNAIRKEINNSVSWADVVHTHGMWQFPCVIAAHACRTIGRPYVVQPHGFLEPERLKKSRVRKFVFGVLFERRILGGCNVVVATAESEKKNIEAYCHKTWIEIIPIGIDTHKIDSAERDEGLMRRLGLSPQKKTLLYMSRMAPIKGLDMLAEVWRDLCVTHDGWQLAITGPNNSYEHTVRGFFRQMKNVVFTGPVYGTEKNVLLKSVDCFILPTRSENFGIAVQEALAAGIPTVCTKGAPWNLIENYDAGRWVDVSVEGIKSGLDYIMSCDCDRRSQMGDNGKLLISENFGWTNIIDGLLTRVYGRVVKNKG